ncbi:hypothetical protein HTV80_12945 [Streptomyces sp. Vc74B-19]|uniref:hypothetical protein n=1 Tax=Streptomyces sp. Vc74B-19 TaxID=2741324 RepID=UPI001BFCC906|nr:hypothetical protein [Streptomyces sp. Vc74B-19]MBT3164017.1 hypothetical protein [Streptomyces sp. Vc74B-19]
MDRRLRHRPWPPRPRTRRLGRLALHLAPRSDPRFWIATPIVAAAVCCLWLFRPRRSWRNWRAWHTSDRQRALPTHTPSRLSDRRTPKEGHRL